MTASASQIRKIIHIDMDAFFAAVEQRDDPNLRGKPVIVGGAPDKRGVVATCSYEARKFGIHSAMSSARALQRCPQAIFVPTRFEVYRTVSQQIHTIFYQYTDIVEPLSLDEAYLDVTENKKNSLLATPLAKEIQQQIYLETGLTASAGVSYNKFLAKMASAFRKPNGLTVIVPERAELFLSQLPIRKFYGVGQATEKKMLAHGIKNGADLRKFSEQELSQYFGKMGRFFYWIVRGVDNRVVTNQRVRKSVGCEHTFEQDIFAEEDIRQALHQLSVRVAQRLERHQLCGHTLTLKIRYADFSTHTKQMTLAKPTADPASIYEFSVKNLENINGNTVAKQQRIRLLGITASALNQSCLSVVLEQGK